MKIIVNMTQAENIQATRSIVADSRCKSAHDFFDEQGLT